MDDTERMFFFLPENLFKYEFRTNEKPTVFFFFPFFKGTNSRHRFCSSASVIFSDHPGKKKAGKLKHFVLLMLMSVWTDQSSVQRHNPGGGGALVGG